MKLTILGAGHVGSAIAFSTVIQGLADELLIINRNHNVALGQAADLQHAATMTSGTIRVRAGNVDDSRNSHAVVICISVPWSPQLGSRDALAAGNCQLLKQWVPQLAAASPRGIFIVVSNPVDAMSYITWKLSGLPSRQVIGTGTLIDSARFRSYLSQHLQIHPDDIRAYILGEHGDGQFAALSSAVTGGQMVESDPTIQQLFERTRLAGHEVVRLKGHTNFAIALSTCMILDAIQADSHRTLPVSSYIDQFQGVSNVYVSVPVVIGRCGVVRQLRPMLNPEEVALFQQSAARVRETLQSVEGLWRSTS